MISFEKLKKNIARLHSEGLTYRQVAAMYPGATFGDVSRILHGVEPATEEKRRAFGLPALKPAPVCEPCGVVHVGRCPGNRRQRRLTEQSAAELAWRLVNREIIQDGNR